MPSNPRVPYSRKFLLVQNFVDLPSRPSEEIFCGSKFCTMQCSSEATPTINDLILANAYEVLGWHFSWSLFSRQYMKPWNFAPCINFPLYGIHCICMSLIYDAISKVVHLLGKGLDLSGEPDHALPSPALNVLHYQHMMQYIQCWRREKVIG